MAFCELCKAEGQKTGNCAYCGTAYYMAGVTFIYGQTEKESYGSEFRLTDKYLIVRKVSNAEMLGNVSAGAAFGLIGALAATAVDAARKKSYGFYDLQDLQKVIYPYRTHSLKKDTAFKFVNKDGSDFILYFNLNGLFSGKAAKNFAAALVKVGVFVENGAGTTYPLCCMKPFVNQDTFGTRVCQSAARFVEMTDQQFVAPPISGPAQAAAAPAQNYSQPAQAIPLQPVQPAPVYQAAVTAAPAAPAMNASAWQSAWQSEAQTPAMDHAEAASAVQKAPEQIMCYTCGGMNSNAARFCKRCGTQLATDQQAAPAFSVDDWKNKW